MQKCPTCGIGVDNNGDGDCAVCASVKKMTNCPECGSTDKKDKKHCHHFWHDLVDGLGNAIGEAMDQR